MKFSATPLAGAWIIETEPFQDRRGKFVRLFRREELRQIHGGRSIEQINYSLTVRTGTVRGLHFQHPPKAEARMVRCLRGAVFDVIVDIRKGSPTFLQWYGRELSDKNMEMLYVPEGFAHGFQTLEDNCEMLYLHSESYEPSLEAGLRYDDAAIGIDWPIEVTEVSDKDRSHPLVSSDFEGAAL